MTTQRKRKAEELNIFVTKPDRELYVKEVKTNEQR